MVKRYPHTAIVTVKSEGNLVNGEWVDGDESTFEIQGRYDPIDKKGEVIRSNPLGDEVKVNGEFYCKEKPVKGAVHLFVESIGIDKPIIQWWAYQTHSIISV